jgi:hypothetical protein
MQFGKGYMNPFLNVLRMVTESLLPGIQCITFAAISCNQDSIPALALLLRALAGEINRPLRVVFSTHPVAIAHLAVLHVRALVLTRTRPISCTFTTNPPMFACAGHLERARMCHVPDLLHWHHLEFHRGPEA